MTPLRLANMVLRGGGLPKLAKRVADDASLLRAMAEDLQAAAKDTERFVTAKQGRDGTYSKGHLRWFGLPITIETPAGAFRRRPGWSSEVMAHYGEIADTVGADGDPIDVFLNPHPECSACLIIDQVHPDTRRFDEHKVMLGWRDAYEALQVYAAAFSDGRGHLRVGHVREMTLEQFRRWLKSNTRIPAARTPMAIDQRLARLKARRDPLYNEARSARSVRYITPKEIRTIGKVR